MNILKSLCLTCRHAIVGQRLAIISRTLSLQVAIVTFASVYIITKYLVPRGMLHASRIKTRTRDGKNKSRKRKRK